MAELCHKPDDIWKLEHKRSNVWLHFLVNKSKAKCVYCGQILTIPNAGTTTSLRFHLLAKNQHWGKIENKIETRNSWYTLLFKSSFAKQIIMLLQFMKEKSLSNVTFVIIIALNIVTWIDILFQSMKERSHLSVVHIHSTF